MTITRKEVAEARQTAKDFGLKRYVGSHCKNHPDNNIRWVANGCCVLCTMARLPAYRKRNATKLLESRKAWDKSNPEKAMLQRSRRRAKDLGLEFNLTIDDIVIPECCPILGMKLTRTSDSKDDSPSLDRIDNDRGYTRGNVVVISFRANRIKGNATINEIRKVVEFYEQY